MTQKSKSASRQLRLSIDSEVVRQIRQHARSSTKTEVCGVLIGQDRPGLVEVQACITGLNAEEAGAHVTFTQDTWEHIYKIKDKEYPEHRIVGWYHTHPGFGVFLSDHDTFIHNNFFSSPGQVAWVYDPHSDEEGCFGWMDGRIERLSQIAIVDRRGGEAANQSGKPEPSFESPMQEESASPKKIRALPDSGRDDSDTDGDSSSLERLVANFFSYLTVLLAGFLLCWLLFPRTVIVPIPIDPRTGRPLPGTLTDSIPGLTDRDKSPMGANEKMESSGSSGAKPEPDTTKGDNAKPK